MDCDDSGITTDIPELIIVRSREDLAAKAAHESDSRVEIVRPGVVFGARRGVD